MFRKGVYTILNIAINYWKKLLTSTALIIISSVTNLIEDTDLKEIHNFDTIILIVKYAPLFLVVAILVFSIIKYSADKKNKARLIQLSMVVDAFYEKNNSYSLIAIQRLINESSIPICDLFGIKEGYLTKPLTVNIKCSVINDDRGRVVNISPPNYARKSIHMTGGTAHNVYLYDWSAFLEPGITKGEQVDVATKIEAQGVEYEAFTSLGTTFAWRVFYETEELNITIHSPPGYFIELLSFSRDDLSGKKINRLIDKFDNPISNSGNNQIYWKINFPLVNIRYSIKYRFKEIDFHD